MACRLQPLWITTNYAQSAQSKQIHLGNLEDELIRITTCSAQEKIGIMFEALDDALRWCVPKAWKNVGREQRNLVMEVCYVSFRRRVYLDENGKRRKPLDETLKLRPYQRNLPVGCHARTADCSRRSLSAQPARRARASGFFFVLAGLMITQPARRAPSEKPDRRSPAFSSFAVLQN